MNERDEDAAAPSTPRARTGSRRGLVVAACAIAGLAAFGLVRVYGIGGAGGNDETAGKCSAAPAAAAHLAPHLRDDVAGVVPASVPRDLSTLAFRDADGSPTTLAAWKGRVVLVNLWATWCPPCRAEMPALDRLQTKAGSKDFEVLTINLDSRDPERPKAFLAEIGATTLAHRTDATLGVFKALKQIGLASGLPTTILVDRQGCELGTMAGPAHWDAPAALSLVEAATKS